VWRRLWALRWWFAIGCLTLMSTSGCLATLGQVRGQQFVSPAYGFEVPLPGDEWSPLNGEPAVLALAHTQLAAGMTISVTCHQERDVPLDILTRHLLFGFKNIEILQQAQQAFNGVPALKTIARAELAGREVQLRGHVVRRNGCIYDIVYFASPQDYSSGESSFERMIAGFRFLQR
jgi:predicted Zn-dependent protease